MHTVYLSLGSNLGEKESNIKRALQLIEVQVGKVSCCSTMLVTEPWGFHSEHSFVNATAKIYTTLTPRDVLKATQQIERTMGRTLKSTNGCYHDRIIDIDILLFDDLRIDETDLHIPHPLMFQRDFVMIPLREVLDSTGKKLIKNFQENII